MTEELEQLGKALKNYHDTYKGNVVIQCSVIAFDENEEPIEEVCVEWDRGPLEAIIANLEFKLLDLKEEYNYFKNNNR